MFIFSSFNRIMERELLMPLLGQVRKFFDRVVDKLLEHLDTDDETEGLTLALGEKINVSLKKAG